MFHFQEPTTDWPRSAVKIPAGYIYKAIDNVQMLSEVKEVNPGLQTNLRHYYQQQSPSATVEENKNNARYFFSTFIDGTFMDHAHNVDYIEEWNEYYSNGQEPAERQRFINWTNACSWVWKNEYRIIPELAHIKLILANAPIGNDIPIEVAHYAIRDDAVVGYHPYWPTQYNQILINEWPWYSGRWTAMDSYYRSEGLHVQWALTEAGSVRYFDCGNGGICLDPAGGWRHPQVHNASVIHYKNAIQYFMNRWFEWNENHDWRAQSIVLFNSHNNPGPDWRSFNIVQPEMDQIAEYIQSWVPGTPIPPQPPVGPCDGLPREDYFRSFIVLSKHIGEAEAVEHFRRAFHDNRQTVGFSYDDAGIGALTNKVARLQGLSTVEKQVMTDWYKQWYPCAKIEFID